MRHLGVTPDKYPFSCVIRACVEDLEVKKIHGLLLKFGFELDVFVGSALVNTYMKFGLVMDAHEVFEELPVRDLVLWNSMLNGYVFGGDFEYVPKYVVLDEPTAVAQRRRNILHTRGHCRLLVLLLMSLSVSLESLLVHIVTLTGISLLLSYRCRRFNISRPSLGSSSPVTEALVGLSSLVIFWFQALAVASRRGSWTVVGSSLALSLVLFWGRVLFVTQSPLVSPCIITSPILPVPSRYPWPNIPISSANKL
ncbi:hypothetical protein S83_043755 [Arachis hypogaea]